jgi:hypothetical protein
MKQRGRVSSSALEIIPSSVIDRAERLRPPHDLTDEETEVWVAVVNVEPADWFSASTGPLLAQYCRHVVHARRIAELLEKALSHVDPNTKLPTLTVDDYDRLLRMQERESGALSMLATKMRIAQQSTTNHRGNKKPSAARKPWEG